MPIVPEKFQHKPIAASKDFLRTIKKILATTKFDKIIIATDAGCEGELIARLVLGHCGIKDFKSVYRFWSSSALTSEVIEKGLLDARPASNYDVLFASGLYRQLSDWLVGINFSRLLSLKLNGIFSFGRVQTAVLCLLVHRFNEHNNFKPKNYYQMEGKFNKGGKEFTAYLHKDDSNKFMSQDFILSLYGQVLKDQDMASVKSVISKLTITPAPLLFNLTALQKAANTKLGFSAKKTLELAQALYETHKALSYPRTPSRVLGEANTDLVSQIINSLKGYYPEVFVNFQEDLISASNKHVFDDSKLEDHHGLIPLAPLPKSASSEESQIYNLVLRSFVAVFSSPFCYDALKVSLDVNDVEFRVQGKQIKSLGWKAIYKDFKAQESSDEEQKDQDLPSLIQGESLNFRGYELLSKKTKPKPIFTEASILAAMENPERFSSQEDLDYHFSKDVGLGTQATRAAIIEVLLKRDYIERKKKKLLPTEKGLHFLKVVEKIPSLKNAIDVKETARWESLLKEDGKDFFAQVLSYVRKTIEEVKGQEVEKFEKKRIAIGGCPKCGKGEIYEGKKSFYCSRYKEGCLFSLWKQSFNTILPKVAIKRLLVGEKTKPLTLKRKDGSVFTAALILDKDYKISFAPRGGVG